MGWKLPPRFSRELLRACIGELRVFVSSSLLLGMEERGGEGGGRDGVRDGVRDSDLFKLNLLTGFGSKYDY